MSSFTETDALIVGGGPAGLAAAIAIRARGLRATVVDRAAPAIDKACGEGLMPNSLAALRILGVTPASADAFPFRGIRFLDGTASVDASFPEGVGLGVRRTVLHRMLATRAAEAGVDLLWGAQVTGLSDGGAHVNGGELRCRWVIGADGRDSRVRGWAGLDAGPRAARRFGSRRHYRVASWTDCTEIYWGARGQIYVTPVGGGEVCVASIARDPHERFDSILPAFPELTRRLEAGVPSSAQRGAVTASRILPRVTAGRVALIGDASGSVDAITGEGLCLAFRQALALADALESGGLASYELEHRQIMRRPRSMCGLLLLLDRYPRLRRRVLGALSSKPRIFSSLLALHVGAVTPAGFFLDGIPPLGWRMLRV